MNALRKLPYILTGETGTYPSDLLSGWFEEDVDYDTSILILKFAKRFNRLTNKQRLYFIEYSEEVVSNLNNLIL